MVNNYFGMQLHTRNMAHLTAKKQRIGTFSFHWFPFQIPEISKFITISAAPFDKNLESSVLDGSLASRLRLNPVKDKDFVPLPGSLLRKYIAYARNFVFPR